MQRSHDRDKRPVIWSIQTEFAKARDLALRGQGPAAEEICRTILKSNRRHFDATCLLGAILLQRNEIEAAAERFQRAIKFATPDIPTQNMAEAHGNYGVALANLGRLEEAVESLKRAIGLAPNLVSAQTNLVSAFHKLGLFADALALADQMIAAHPTSASAHYARGRALDRLHRFEAALLSFNQAIALKPNYHEAYYGRSLCRLMLGNFRQGWDDGEHRWHCPGFSANHDPAFAPSSLMREALKGKRILVAAEQGAGDEIMFASMIPDLQRDARSVSLECDRRFIGLFGRSFEGVNLVARISPPIWKGAEFDYVVPAQSLGHLYRDAAADFPNRVSFLMASDMITDSWKRRLSGLGDGMKIGISWQGGADHTRRRERSMPLEMLARNLTIENACLVSLQYGQTRQEIEEVNQSLAKPVIRFESSQIDDFDQLAGLVSALDVVITVDNTMAQLCGALGKSLQRAASPRV